MRSAAGWLVLAASLALISTAIDRTTRVEVFSDGGRIHLEVAGSVLSAPRSIERLTAVEIVATDSIDPPGGRSITLSGGEGSVVLHERLPGRFFIPPGAIVPLGDWELDELAGRGSVWSRAVDVRGPFTLEASFRGRFLHDLTVVLHGNPTTSIAVRRGLINDDCFICDGDGTTLAVTSIDPTPLADAGAIGATLARSGAVACLLIGFFSVFQAGFRPHPLPASAARIPAATLVLALALAALGLSAWVARDVLEGLPHTPDEVVYLLQAGWILDGSLWSEVTNIQGLITLPFTYIDGNRWLAHYPPGWPGLLAAGVAAGAPWLVAPVLGGVYVVLLFLAGRELDGPPLGLAAAALALISPIARLIFGSMLSHAFAATLVLAALVLALRARRTARWTTAAAAGAALGMALAVRPLTAVAVALPMLALTLPEEDRPGARRRLAGSCFAGGFGLAALPALAVNALITGRLFSFPYTFAGGSMFGASNIPFGVRNLDALLASSGAASTGWGWSSFHGPWIIALCFAPALVPLLTGRRRTVDWLLAAMVVSVFIAHVGTRGHGMHGFGPRYHFEVMAPFYLLCAKGFFDLARIGVDRRRFEKKIPVAVSFIIYFSLCLPAAAILPSRLSLYRGYNGVDGGLERQIVERRLNRALVVLPTGEWQGWAAVSRHLDFHPDAPILVIQTDADDPAIPAVAGDRPVFLWRGGRLTPR